MGDMDMDFSTRRFYTGVLCFFTVALAACGTAKPMPDFNTFQHRVTDGTVALYWNCSRPATGMVRVEGVANNPYYPTPIQDLEFRLYGVTAQGSNISRARGSAQDFLIEMNAPSSFTIGLKILGEEVRYDLVYSYMMAARGLGGAMGGEQQNMARDVCAGLAP